MQETSACKRRPTASFGAARGTWTSSTRSTASRRRPATSPSSSATLKERSSHAAAMQVVGRFGVSETIFGDVIRHASREAVQRRPRSSRSPPRHGSLRGGRAAIDPTVYPGLDAFWSDLTAAYAGGARRRWPRLDVPAVDDTGLAYPNDPSCGSTSPASAATPSDSSSSTSATSTRPWQRARRVGGDDAHVPGVLPLLVGGRGRLRLRRRSVFNELQVDGFFLEYDDERSGSFEPLRFVPKGKQVVLGLVTTKRGVLEGGHLKRRIERRHASSPLDQLCLRPSAGSPRARGQRALARRANRRSFALSWRLQRVWST